MYYSPFAIHNSLDELHTTVETGICLINGKVFIRSKPEDLPDQTTFNFAFG